MTLRPLLAAVLLAVSAAPRAAAQTDTASSAAMDAGVVLVSGRVVDARTGRPLRAAVVRFPTATVNVFTDADGRFAAPVPAGEHTAGVWLIGYRPRGVRWRVAEGDTARLIALEPDSGMAEALRAADTRIERRARAAGITPQRWRRDVLIADTSASVAAFVLRNARLPWAECGSRGGADPRTGVGSTLPRVNVLRLPGCVRLQNRTTTACVLVDEQLSSLDALALVSPADLYRLEAYGQTAVIVAFTNAFVERLAIRRAALAPMEWQARNLCNPPH